MKKNKLTYVLIVASVLLLIVIVCMLPSLNDKNHIKDMNYSKFKTQIKIDVEKDDGGLKNYLITVEDDSSVARVQTNFTDGYTYITNADVYYESGGRYKTFKVENSYRNLYNSIKKIDLGEVVTQENEMKSYNPKVDSDRINEILNNLFIDKEVERAESAYIVLDDDVLKEFTLYIIGIDGYRGVNITISFSELDNSFKIDRPVIYDEALDEVENDRFAIIE